MLRSPRATLARDPAESLDLALLIVVDFRRRAAPAFCMTRVGRLAALDQPVRQLESFGTVVTDESMRDCARGCPIGRCIGAASDCGRLAADVADGAAVILRRSGTGPARTTRRFAQVLTVLVHASSVFAAPRGRRGAAELRARVHRRRDEPGLVLPVFGESTFRGPAAGRDRHFRAVVGRARRDGAEHAVPDGARLPLRDGCSASMPPARWRWR